METASIGNALDRTVGSPTGTRGYFVLGTLETTPSFTRLVRQIASAGHRRLSLPRNMRAVSVLGLCLAACIVVRFAHTLIGEHLLVSLCMVTIGVVVTLPSYARTSLYGPSQHGGPLPGNNASGEIRVARRGGPVQNLTADRPTSGTPAVSERQVPDEIKAGLVALVSREVRSPMAAIVQAAKIITQHQHSRPDVVDRFGRAIACEGERMIGLLNDYLNVAAGAASQSRLEGEVAAAVIVDEALSDLDERAARRNIQLIEAVEAGLPTLHVDRHRLVVALRHLVQHAIDTTPRGGSVTVRAGLLGGTIVFGVDDTGAGLAADEISAVFERKGLGLHISREVVTRYDGHIRAESAAGRGSSLVFAVPVHRAR